MFTIGLDLDFTLINWLVPPEVKAAMDLGIKEWPKPIEYEYRNLDPAHRARVIELFDDPSFMGMENCIYNWPDRLALINWKKDGHRLVVISSRKDPVRKITEELVKTYFPEVDRLIICEHTENKQDFMLEERLDIWIDDSPKGIEIAVPIVTYIFMICNGKTRYWNEATCLKYRNFCNFFSVWSVYGAYELMTFNRRHFIKRNG